MLECFLEPLDLPAFSFKEGLRGKHSAKGGQVTGVDTTRASEMKFWQLTLLTRNSLISPLSATFFVEERVHLYRLYISHHT